MSNAIVLDGWTIKVDGAEPRVRDLDLGERAGLRVARDVRRTIRGAVADGALTIVGAGHDAPGGAPGLRVWAELESTAIGSGASRAVETFYLSEDAALFVLTRLRTKVAVEVTKALVRVFSAARRGELAPAAPEAPAAPFVSPAPGGLEAYREGVAALERAKAEGAIDGKGLALRQAELLERHLGIDILSAPARGFAPLPELSAPAAAALASGQRVMMTPVVDTAGHLPASEVGRPYGLSGQAVGKIAVAIGIRHKDGFGMWRLFPSNDGKKEIKHWMYNDAAVAALAPRIEEEVARRRALAERGALRPKRLGGQAPLALVATPPSAAPAAGPTGRGAA